MTTDAERIALLTEHNDLLLANVDKLNAQLTERDAIIADLQRDVEQLTTSNAEADATIEALRAQVATLTERLDRCTCTDDYGNVKE